MGDFDNDTFDDISPMFRTWDGRPSAERNYHVARDRAKARARRGWELRERRSAYDLAQTVGRAGHPMTIDALATALGWTLSSVSAAASHAVKHGLLIRVSSGLYAVPPKP